jgi:hypothetical protein
MLGGAACLDVLDDLAAGELGWQVVCEAGQG